MNLSKLFIGLGDLSLWAILRTGVFSDCKAVCFELFYSNHWSYALCFHNSSESKQLMKDIKGFARDYFATPAASVFCVFRQTYICVCLLESHGSYNHTGKGTVCIHGSWKLDWLCIIFVTWNTILHNQALPIRNPERGSSGERQKRLQGITSKPTEN